MFGDFLSFSSRGVIRRVDQGRACGAAVDVYRVYMAEQREFASDDLVLYLQKIDALFPQTASKVCLSLSLSLELFLVAACSLSCGGALAAASASL